MTVRADRDALCWEPVDALTGELYYARVEWDRWPHYRDRAECAEAIAELHAERDRYDHLPLLLIARPCFDSPCVEFVCDECGEVFDYEGEGGAHFDPATRLPDAFEDCEWTVERRPGQPDRHYCPEDPVPWCEECDEQHPAGECDAPPPAWRPVPVSPDQGTPL